MSFCGQTHSAPYRGHGSILLRFWGGGGGGEQGYENGNTTTSVILSLDHIVSTPPVNQLNHHNC